MWSDPVDSFSGGLELHGIVLWFCHPSWLDSLEGLSMELLSLGAWPLGGLFFQRSRPPCSAKDPSQLTWSSETPNSRGTALCQSGSFWHGPLGELSSVFGSSRSVGSCVLAFPGQEPLDVSSLWFSSSRSVVSCRQASPEISSPQSGSLVSLFPVAWHSGGVGRCGPGRL